jgi:hypothetical protein
VIADYFLTRERPRMTMMEPPTKASAPAPIAGSISGTVGEANAACAATSVATSTARRLRAEFFIERKISFDS